MSSPVLGNILGDVVTWVRRIVKGAAGTAMNQDTIIDYINRFYIYDIPAALQLFELKRSYSFDTVANIDVYDFPYREYQMVGQPIYRDGIEMGYFQDNFQFYRSFPEQIFNLQPLMGSGITGPYFYTSPQIPIKRSYRDQLGYFFPRVIISAQNLTGTTQFLVDDGEGGFNQTDSSFQEIISPVTDGFVDYLTGEMEFTFVDPVDAGVPITIQTVPYQSGTPIGILFWNNLFKFYPVPSKQFKIECQVYITPSAFLNSEAAVPFGYMSEYIARGAARKILSDAGDVEQFQFYEQFFREQENQVLRRTSRQNTTQRTPTIYSAQTAYNYYYPYRQY